MTKQQLYIKNSIIILLLLFSIVFINPASTLITSAKQTISKQDLVLVSDYSSGFSIDMKYATFDNFTGKTLYPSPTCVLTKGTLEKLIKANNILTKQGYRIKIWDAYRPLSVQKIMWEAAPDKNYVASPNGSGSKHNRGAAVDVTLVDSKGKELKMPTGFDNFTAKASPNYKGMTAEQRKNLNILTNAMTSSGFKPLSTEWWHFDDTDWKSCKVRDVSLGSFDKTNYTLDGNKIADLKFVKSNNTSQLIVVTSQLSNSSNVVISTYEKKSGVWVNVLKNIPGYIGLKGFSVNKQEGDKKTPVGAFKVGTCFSKTSNIATGLDFYKYDSKDVWVDDPNSKYYNTHQREPVQGRWKSAENFSRTKNGVYDVFFNIEYNTARVKNKGSAIFFHIANPNAVIKYTVGCVSTDRQNLLAIVKWLDKDKNPMILQGPLYEIGKY
ncbi:MAG TPA: M15 family metallopeptidase [Ruminiclostridium sp.]|nr:M15 family metallopeptidase [Ruminiclostridium sp.]